jgi:hypothetical protein
METKKIKALTIKNPWAHLIISGVKDIENRTWKTSYRGKLWIHVGNNNFSLKKIGFENFFTEEQVDMIYNNGKSYIKELLDSEDTKSCIIGHVELVDCVLKHPSSIWAEKAKEDETPIWNWVLKNPVKFSKPIPNVKGKLSLWDWDNVE